MTQLSNALSERSLCLFKALVEHFIRDGAPVGSRALARDQNIDLSAATIRNVMADLEEIGLLHSPHTSSGRMPTSKGYRLFIDSLLHVNDLDSNEAEKIARELDPETDLSVLMRRASTMLSDITHLAGVVMLPRKSDVSLQHIEFIPLSRNKILVILVIENQQIQNRIINVERSYKLTELQEISNYLNTLFSGKSLSDIKASIIEELQQMKKKVDQLMQKSIEMAQMVFHNQDAKADEDELLFSGETNLMDVAELSDITRLKKLFDSFNHKRGILHLLEHAINADGLQIFIGEEAGYEELKDCSVITSPYESEDGRIIGVLGVIGPTRMHYEYVIPVVDMTAKMLSVALKSKNHLYS